MKRILTFFMTMAISAGAAQAQKISFGVNLAEAACLGTIEGTLQYRIHPHWSLECGARYNNWEFAKAEDCLFDKRRDFYAGARLWIADSGSGWWSGMRIQTEEYNRYGLFGNTLKEEGDALGISVGAGWSRPLWGKWRIDAGLYVWGGGKTYCSYAAPHCGRCLIEKGRKGFVRYDCAVLSLSRNLGKPNNQSSKKQTK